MLFYWRLFTVSNLLMAWRCARCKGNGWEESNVLAGVVVIAFAVDISEWRGGMLWVPSAI